MILNMRVSGLPHCPRNRSHTIIKKGKTAFLGKTEAARAYELSLRHHLKKFQVAAESFKNNFNKNTQHLHATWIFSSPEVTTSTGKISETGTDLDSHKVLQDVVMGFVGINDAYIVVDKRSKVFGPYDVQVILSIHDNDWVNGEELL